VKPVSEASAAPRASLRVGMTRASLALSASSNLRAAAALRTAAAPAYYNLKQGTRTGPRLPVDLSLSPEARSGQVRFIMSTQPTSV
jgi:hypothetical protein